MTPRKWFVMEEAGEVPAGGGAPAPDSGSDVDWVAESNLHEESEAPQEPAPAQSTPSPAAPASATPATETPSTPAPAATPAQPVAPAAAPAVVPPAQPAAPTPPDAGEQPTEAVPATPPQPVDMQALRATEISRLTALYGMTEEDARTVLVEPEKVLPRIMANLHANIVDAVVPAIFGRLPQVVQDLSQKANAVRDAETEFFGVWPQLKDKRFETVVANSIRAYKAVNPQAKRSEIIRAAGLNALISLRLPIPAELLTPAAPMTHEAPGFVPAAPAGGGVPPAPRSQPNAFQLLNEELDQEEGRRH